MYQHIEGPFNLVDRTKPGHRKMIVLSLVDPTKRITSTAHIPPQDTSWIDNDLLEKVMEKLPTELVETILREYVENTSLEKALDHKRRCTERRRMDTDRVYSDEEFEQLVLDL
jgi:uncharacterized protein (DUF2384 family)